MTELWLTLATVGGTFINLGIVVTAFWWERRKRKAASVQVEMPGGLSQMLSAMSGSQAERQEHPLEITQRYITVEYYAVKDSARKLVEVRRIENISCKELKELLYSEAIRTKRFVSNEVELSGNPFSERMDAMVAGVLVKEAEESFS